MNKKFEDKKSYGGSSSKSFARSYERQAPVWANPDAKDEEISREEWEPSTKQMLAYLKREKELAVGNLRLCLLSGPLSFKNLRECVLHTADTMEQVITSEIASGRVKEDSGEYSLV